MSQEEFHPPNDPAAARLVKILEKKNLVQTSQEKKKEVKRPQMADGHYFTKKPIFEVIQQSSLFLN